MSEKAFIVVGLGFGDEGKGLTTDYLCCETKNSLVIRFNGGHQAGHTVVISAGKRHVFSNFGAGTLRGVPTYWSNYCTFSPGSFLKEYKGLQELEVRPVLYVDKLCPVTTHYDVLYNRIVEEERGKARHGSCGLGFGATTERHYFSPVKLYAQDLLFPEICILKLKAIRQYYQLKIKSASGIAFEKLNHETEDQRFYQYIQDIDKLHKESVIHFVNEQDIFSHPYPWENFIFEGAQGILLDMDFGFFPHVTRSNTTSKNALRLINRHLKDRLSGVTIIYVSRAYQTRHGEGPMTYKENTVKLINNEAETNQYNEFQGNFRVSPLDINLLQYALQCDNTFSQGLQKNLLITCLDQLEDKLIHCYKSNHQHIVSPIALAQMIFNGFNQSLFSFSDCAENLSGG